MPTYEIFESVTDSVWDLYECEDLATAEQRAIELSEANPTDGSCVRHFDFYLIHQQTRERAHLSYLRVPSYPRMPACISESHKHEWEHVSSFGSGHGRTAEETKCHQCRATRVIDHGATDPHNGERMQAISYSK